MNEPTNEIMNTKSTKSNQNPNPPKIPEKARAGRGGAAAVISSRPASRGSRAVSSGASAVRCPRRGSGNPAGE